MWVNNNRWFGKRITDFNYKAPSKRFYSFTMGKGEKIMPVPEGIITTTEILQDSGTTVVPPEPEVEDTKEEAEDAK
jgi:hypothetical protein